MAESNWVYGFRSYEGALLSNVFSAREDMSRERVVRAGGTFGVDQSFDKAKRRRVRAKGWTEINTYNCHINNVSQPALRTELA